MAVHVHEVDEDLYDFVIVTICVEVACVQRLVMGKVAQQHHAATPRDVSQVVRRDPQNRLVEDDVDRVRNQNQRVLQSNDALKRPNLVIREPFQRIEQTVEYGIAVVYIDFEPPKQAVSLALNRFYDPTIEELLKQRHARLAQLSDVVGLKLAHREPLRMSSVLEHSRRVGEIPRQQKSCSPHHAV